MTEEEVTKRGVLDTSTLILLERVDDQSSLPRQPVITAITLAELSVGPLIAGDPTERATRQARLQQAEADFDPLPFDAAAAAPLVALRHHCARPGERRTPVRTTP